MHAVRPQGRHPEKTKVNVYNASNRSGLAATVARQLKDRDFVIGAVANDPSKRGAPKVAEIRYGAKGTAQAKLLRTAMPKGTTLVKDKRKVVTVDLALGATALSMCPAPSPS